MSEIQDVPTVEASSEVEAMETPLADEPAAQVEATTAPGPTEDVEPTQTPSDEVVDAVATEDVATESPIEQKGDQIDTPEQSPGQELVEEAPVYAGLLSYKKASATFPRYFYFAEEPVPLEKLHAFYEKYKKLKVDRDELDQLVAHAAASSAGLLFFSKTPDSVPSGILECSRMVEIKADEHMSDKFTISYGGKQVFHFETGVTSRNAWVAGIVSKKTNSAEKVEEVRNSAVYLQHLKALEDGTAFKPLTVPENAQDVLSDEEVVGPAETSPPAERAETKSDLPVGRRASLFLHSLKEKLPHEKIIQESASEEKIEKTPKKEKRKSFLTGLMYKREAMAPQSIENSDKKALPAEPISGETVTSSAEDESIVPETATVTASPEPAKDIADKPAGSPKSPLKEKVDGFFAKVRKMGEREEKPQSSVIVESTTATDAVSEPATETTVQVSEVAAAADPEASDVPVECSTKPLQDETTTTAVTPESDVEALEVAAITADPEDAEQKRPSGLARKLTSLFRGRKTVKTPAMASPLVTSTEPPQLPETAKVEPDAQVTTDSTVNEASTATVTDSTELADEIQPAILAPSLATTDAPVADSQPSQ